MDSVFATFKAIPWFSIHDEMGSKYSSPTADSHTVLEFCHHHLVSLLPDRAQWRILISVSVSFFFREQVISRPPNPQPGGPVAVLRLASTL